MRSIARVGWVASCVLVGACAMASEKEGVVPRADFVVAPGGNDSGPGTPERPFATLERAQAAVRERTAAGLKADLVVLVHGGTYRIAEAIAAARASAGLEPAWRNLLPAD